MAYLSDDIQDPLSYSDYPDVLRLETTNKVYGGKYTDGDGDKGISNLQAMQLMERDDYILRRVGQASVAPVGDTPGKPGIAGLDTTGKVPDGQLAANVIRNTAVQTLTNKTIDKASSTVTCSPTVISSATTLTPAKEMNAVISAALTLGNGPYIGYTLPVTATAATTVTYVSANGIVTDNLDAGQTVNYIWKGSYWGSVSNASLPVFISTTQTVEPTMDMNYVVDNTGIMLTVDSGAYIGHKVSVTATANCSVAYLGADGSTTLSLATGYRAELTWNGSYWLMDMFAVVEGLDAQGNPFRYGGDMSIAASPSAYITIDTDGDTLDPSEGEKFILDIDTVGAACSLDAGAYTFQTVKMVNLNEETVLLSYDGPGGVTTMSIAHLKTAMFTWNGSNWTAVVTESFTGTNNKGQPYQYDGVLSVQVRPESVLDYSTTEQPTGALWIDGKPIYRKVYQYNSSISVSTDFQQILISSVSDLNIDRLISATGSLRYTSGATTTEYIPYFAYASSTYYGFHFIVQNNGLYVQCIGASGTANSVMAILEYTKTTD